MADEPGFGTDAPGAVDSGELPAEREYRQHVSFQMAMAASPTPVVTYGLIAINILIFAAMVVRGISPIEPSVAQVLPWGANFGPLTLGGQWWRLLTACFLHFGIIHVGMNMFILFQVGIFAEKLFGNGRYLLLYLLAGVGGNIAGLYVHPMTVAAGASGAVFGVYGGLLAYLLMQRGVVPTSSAMSIAKSAGIFLIYNLIYGLSSKTTDLTAHIGGLITGFAVGCVLARPLSTEGQRLYPVRTLGVAFGGIALASLAMAGIPRAGMPNGQWYWQIHFGPSVTVGKNDRVAYAGDATKTEAEGLAKALLSVGFFRNPDVVVLLTKDSRETSLSIPIWRDDGASPGAATEAPPWDDPEFLSGIRMFGVQVAPSVGGPPLKVLLVNGKGDLKKSITIDARQVTIGTRDNVWYAGSATTREADALGKALQTSGFFRDHGGLALLTKQNGETDLALVVREGSWDNPGMLPVFQEIVRKVAPSIGGLPIHLQLMDSHEQTRKTLLVQ